MLERLRDSGQSETRDGDLIEEAIVGQIALLWQTRPLRRERLYVADEVEIALAYFRDRLLPALPALYARWERILSHRPASFLRLGSWIGGDRDGNPNVTADSLRLALRRASQTVIASYLEQVHALGADLSISTELSTPTDAVMTLADQSGDRNPARRDEPYRRAITGIYARLAASYESLTGLQAQRPASIAREPYACVEQFRADLAAIAQSLDAAGSGLIAASGGLGRLLRAVDTCGFHLATLDLRQNADVHARVVADLLKVAGVEADYAALDEAARGSCCGASSRASGRWRARLPRTRTRPSPKWRSCGRPPRRGPSTGRRQLPRTSCRSATASPICSRSVSCSRRPASIVRRSPPLRSWWCRCSRRSPTSQMPRASCAPGCRCPRSLARRRRGATRK